MPIVEGGSSRVWSDSQDLVLDGSKSYDPNLEDGDQTPLSFHWACVAATQVSHGGARPPRPAWGVCVMSPAGLGSECPVKGGGGGSGWTTVVGRGSCCCRPEQLWGLTTTPRYGLQSETGGCVLNFGPRGSSVVTIPRERLRAGVEYTFNLTVWKAGRKEEVTSQTVGATTAQPWRALGPRDGRGWRGGAHAVPSSRS